MAAAATRADVAGSRPGACQMARADVARRRPGACRTRAKEKQHRRRVDPTCWSFHRRVGARAMSDGGVLGGDLTVVTGSIR